MERHRYMYIMYSCCKTKRFYLLIFVQYYFIQRNEGLKKKTHMFMYVCYKFYNFSNLICPNYLTISNSSVELKTFMLFWIVKCRGICLRYMWKVLWIFRMFTSVRVQGIWSTCILVSGQEHVHQTSRLECNPLFHWVPKM